MSALCFQELCKSARGQRRLLVSLITDTDTKRIPDAGRPTASSLWAIKWPLAFIVSLILCLRAAETQGSDSEAPLWAMTLKSQVRRAAGF